MTEVFSKEEFNQLINLSGEVRGMPLKSYGKYVLREEGEQALKKLEEAISEIGFSIDYVKIKTMDFYPLSLLAFTLIAIKRLFHYDEKRFEELGRVQLKDSMIIRLFMKYFFSLDLVVKRLSKLWKEHLTVGNLEAIEFNKEKKQMILRIKGYKLHPLHCLVLKGYFLEALEMIVKSSGRCQETKCIFRGDPYHEFLLEW